MPLIGIFRPLRIFLGSGPKNRSVWNGCSRVAEYPGDRGELLLGIVGENLVLAVPLIELELYGLWKQPVPAYGFAGFQLVVDDHDVGVQQQDVATILLAVRRCSEAVIATDSLLCILEVLLPHRIVRQAAICVRGVTAGIEMFSPDNMRTSFP